MSQILLVDDDASFLCVYSEILETNGHTVQTATSGQACLDLLQKEFFEIVVIDMLMPEMNGIELLRHLRHDYPHMMVLVLTGEGSIPNAVEAMELGAFTYMVKPVEIETLLHNIRRAEEFYRLSSENTSLRSKLSHRDTSPTLVGHSSYIRNMIEDIQQIAPASSSVLITGESGTGKEVIVDMIHSASPRCKGPLVKVNCGALSESLLESELFGYEKGAFTGATARKIGYFELSSGGTLFLDEIGDLPLHLQHKLLRVLQEKCFARVGSTKSIYSDFRLICATNKDLKEEISAGSFREDLYYRLNVIRLITSPLREHPEDIPDLVQHFLTFYAQEMNKKPVELLPAAMELLQQYSWPGNVREVKNLCERLMVFARGGCVDADAIRTRLGEDCGKPAEEPSGTLRDADDQFQASFLAKRLEEQHWNISRTAQLLGISRKTLQLKIKQYQLKPL